MVGVVDLLAALGQIDPLGRIGNERRRLKSLWFDFIKFLLVFRIPGILLESGAGVP